MYRQKCECFVSILIIVMKEFLIPLRLLKSTKFFRIYVAVELNLLCGAELIFFVVSHENNNFLLLCEVF